MEQPRIKAAEVWAVTLNVTRVVYRIGKLVVEFSILVIGTAGSALMAFAAILQLRTTDAILVKSHTFASVTEARDIGIVMLMIATVFCVVGLNEIFKWVDKNAPNFMRGLTSK